MISGFCSSCGAAKVSPNAQFCHICGASLDPGGQAKLPGAFLAAPPHRPVVSPRRATHMTVGLIFATIGFGLVVGSIEFNSGSSTYFSYLYSHFNGNGIPDAEFLRATISLVVITTFMLIGSFCYGILRLAQRSIAQTWLESLGIGSCAFFLLYVIGASAIFPDFSDIYDPEKRLLVLIVITGIFFSGLGTLIGVGIASSLARWQSFRPQSLGFSLEYITGLAFGPLFLILVVLMLLIAFDQNDSVFLLYLSMFLGVAIFGMPFIARGIVLDRLRRVRPDLFL